MRKTRKPSNQETREVLNPRQMILRLQKAMEAIQNRLVSKNLIKIFVIRVWSKCKLELYLTVILFQMKHVVRWSHNSRSRKESLRDSLLTPVQVYLAQRLSVSTRVLWTLQVAGSTSGSQTLILLFSQRAHS